MESLQIVSRTDQVSFQRDFPWLLAVAKVVANARTPRDIDPNPAVQTAKRSETIAQAFRPGNQHPRKCALKGRHTYVAPIGLFQEAVTETHSVALAGQISFLF